MSTLAIAATAALALAAAAAKGSSARAPKPDLGAPPSWLTVARNGSNHATADSCFIEPCLSARRLTGLTSSPQAF